MIPWAASAEGICYRNTESRAIEYLDLATWCMTRKATLERGFPWGAAISVSPDGRWILYPQVDRSEEDMMLVENFRWQQVT